MFFCRTILEKNALKNDEKCPFLIKIAPHIKPSTLPFSAFTMFLRFYFEKS